MFKKFKDRKYLFIPDGKSNFTSYDKKLLISMFFANLSLTAFLIMAIGAYWSKQLPEYKTMRARCELVHQIHRADARIDSEIEMQKASRRMQDNSIGIKIEPLEKQGRPLLDLLQEYKQKFN